MKNKIKLIFTSIILLFFTTNFLFAAKKTSSQNDVFSSYNEEFANVNRTSIQYMESNDYQNALNSFYSSNYDCFSFNRENFSSNYSSLSLREIDRIINNVKSNLDKYKKVQSQVATLKFSYQNSLNFTEYEPYFTQLAQIYNSLYDDGWKLKRSGSDQYCQYLSRFILGINEDSRSGIIGVLTSQWNYLLTAESFYLNQEIQTSIKAIASFYSTTSLYNEAVNTDKIVGSITKLKSDSEALNKINSLYKKLNLSNQRNIQIQYDNKAKSSQNLNKFTDTLTKSIVLINQINKAKIVPDKNGLTLQDFRSGNDSFSTVMVENAKQLSALSKSVASIKRSSEILTLQSFQLQELRYTELTSPFVTFCSRAESFCTTSSVNNWIDVAIYYSDKANELLADNSETYKKIYSLIENDEGVYYPGRAVEQFGQLDKQISQDVSLLSACKTKLGDGYAYRSNFTKEIDNINEKETAILEVQSKLSQSSYEARQKVLASQMAKNEIDIFYNNSLKYYNANNFSLSFENLTRAQNAYSINLEQLKNDKDIQEEVFEKLGKLRQDIIDKEKPVYNSQIRQLKNQARIAYYAGDFNSANSTIVQIEDRRTNWSKLMDIPMTEDSELERLKDFITTALTIKEGREISYYDSKAPEMIQNMSLAKKFYYQAEDLWNQGKTEEATVLFEKATEKINQIKIYYPRNREASLLSLKIDRIVNQDTFAQIYAAKVNALSEVNFSDRSSQSQQAYSDLLDLYELDPNYPGLKIIISKAELDLGLKVRNATEAEKAKSLELTQQAQRKLNAAHRDAIALAEAKQLAETALQLNPQNTAAITLLDEISLRTGSSSAVVLSARDEELYQKALVDLQNNRIFDAAAKMNELSKNPDNLNSAKVLKLKKRIEALL